MPDTPVTPPNPNEVLQHIVTTFGNAVVLGAGAALGWTITMRLFVATIG